MRRTITLDGRFFGYNIWLPVWSHAGSFGGKQNVGYWRGNNRKQPFRVLQMHNHYTSLSGHIVF